jgi:hypothetical protein
MRISIIAVLTASLIAVGAQAADAPGEIKLGTLYASSGPFSDTSVPLHRGLKFWVLHRPCEVGKTGVIFCTGEIVGRSILRCFNVDVHVACDDRISLYPAAPFRLATLLHAWTTAQVGRGSSLKRQTGWARTANPHNSHTSDPPDAPEGASEL